MKSYKLIKEYPGSPELGTILKEPRITSHTLSGDCKEEITESDSAICFKEYWQEIVESKQPLFITEDGVGICEGDKFWYVNNIHKGNWYLSEKTIAQKGASHSISVENCKDFSTKQAAEDYILINKPCLSINDLSSMITKFNKNFVYDIKWIEYLKQLVKSKL